ncbi:MAG: response regulator [Bacilli bacterium]|jgi:response regulator receiver domain
MENVIYIFVILVIVVIAIIFMIKEHKQFIEEDEIRNKELNRIKKRIDEVKEDLGDVEEMPEYEFEKWEEEVRKDMVSIVNIKQKYSTNKEVHILIGDYNKSSVSNSVSVLESLGTKVSIAKSGKEIIDRINNGEKYDLIITNSIYDRGHIDGPQMLQELKEKENFNIPIIVLTVSDNQREKFVDYYGFDEYMTKLLTQEKVIETLPKVIKGLEFKKISSKS